MKFAIAVAIAVNFWTGRGVDVPCAPVAVPGADAQLLRDAWGYPIPMSAASGCRILLSREGGLLRVHGPDWYCADIVHEVGHLAGVPHAQSGVMAETMYMDAIPHDCVHWRKTARRLGFEVARQGSGTTK